MRTEALVGLAAGLLLIGAAPVWGQQPARRDLQLNGPRLNGTALGVSSKGQALALAVVLLKDGGTLPDGKPVKLRLQGPELVPVDPAAPAANAAAPLIGAVLRGEATNRDPVKVRIDGVTRGADPDVALYDLSYEHNGGWQPVCNKGERAIAIAGRWDYHLGRLGDSGRVSSVPDEVTFSCQGAAIAKCVEHLGYKPWRSTQELALHEVCVRALRADYCGNGESNTTDGQQINIYDVVGLHKDTLEWTPEARWTSAGASCISSTRLVTRPPRPAAPNQEPKPEEVGTYLTHACNKAVSTRPCAPGANEPTTVLFTEHPPR